MAPRASTLRERLDRTGRFASLALHRTERSIDGQIGLRQIQHAVSTALTELQAEQARDQVTDRQRIIKYKAVASAIRRGDEQTAIAALVSLAGFEYADEYREDAHRDGAIAATERLETNVAGLHEALHDLTPMLIEGIPAALLERQQRKAARA